MADIQVKVVKVLKEEDTKQGKIRLRIVRWIVDGKEGAAKLEKRGFYDNADGEEKTGKAYGLSHTEVKQIVDNWTEIEPLMK